MNQISRSRETVCSGCGRACRASSNTWQCQSMDCRAWNKIGSDGVSRGLDISRLTPCDPRRPTYRPSLLEGGRSERREEVSAIPHRPWVPTAGGGIDSTYVLPHALKTNTLSHKAFRDSAAKMTTKTDQIMVHKPEQTQNGGYAVTVSRAAWVNFKRRKFVASLATEALELANKFARALPDIASWEIAARPPRKVRRQPVKPRRIRGGSVFFSKSANRWLASVYLGRDERGNKILRVLKCDSEADAGERLNRFIEGYNKSIA